MTEIKKKNRGLRVLQKYGALVLFVAVWELVCFINQSVEFINPGLFPAPHTLVQALIEQADRGYLQEDILISLSRVIKGFVIASIIGIILGVLSGFFKPCTSIINPIVELFRPIPALAFLPMFLLWFGIGEASKVMFISFGAFFTIYVNTYQAVLYTPPTLVRAAKCLGANKFQILYKVVIPNAMPGIMTGLRLGFGISLFVLVSAELIAASSGLGFRIMDSRSNFAVDVMLADAFVIGILGLIFGKLFNLLERFVLRWSDSVA